MVTSLLNFLRQVNIEEGIEAKSKTSKSGVLQVRRTSPLQFACNLGLYKLVDVLLKEGANPNGQVPDAYHCLRYDFQDG